MDSSWVSHVAVWEVVWRAVVALGAVLVISQRVREWRSERERRKPRICAHCDRPITDIFLDTPTGPMHKHCFLTRRRQS